MLRRAPAPVLLAVLACRANEPTLTPDEIEARGREVRERLAAECEAGDESACRRLAGAEREPVSDAAAGVEVGATAKAPKSGTLEIDSWPGGATGLSLGVSPAQTVDECTTFGGTAIMLRADQTPVAQPEHIDDGGSVLCVDRRKHDPRKRLGSLDSFFLLTTDFATVNYCLWNEKLTACAVHLGFSDVSRHFAMELRRKLEQEFGPMDPSDADYQCERQGDRENAFRGMWFWATTKLDESGDPFPVGTALLNYGCTPLVKRPEPFFVVRDTIGMLRSIGRLRDGRIVR